MTRAREQLYCIHCLERRLHGQFREQSPSPFLNEIPEEVREEVRLARANFYSQEQPAWRERPLGAGGGYGGGYGGSSNRYASQQYGNRRPSSPQRPQVSAPR